MTDTNTPSMPHLAAHHGDFASFRDVMIETSVGRFGAIWWGVMGQHVLPSLPADASVVDLGTGPGLLLPMLRERLPEASITGVEIQPVMLETARELAAGCDARIVEADLGGPLPIADASADLTLAVMSFHELPHPPVLLEHAARITKPGGIFVIYDWVKRPLRDYMGDKEMSEDLLQHFREHCLFAADDLAYLTEQAGFETLEVVGRRGGRYAIIVARRLS